MKTKHHFIKALTVFVRLLIGTSGLLCLVGCGYISSELSWYSENSSFATISGSAPMFANASSASLTQSTVACSAATESVTVSLHQILEDGSIDPEALASGSVDGAGNFELTKVAIKEINIASSVGSNSILKASGCDMDFYKPLTDTKDQEISFASTVIALTTKVDDSGKVPLTDIDKSDLSQLESDLKVLSGSSLSQFTSALIANSALSQKFQGVFNINPGKLKELPPAKWSVTAPLQVTEASTTNYSVSINHWNQDYVPAYQWLLDGVEVSTSSSFVLTTNKNSQGTKSLVLKVGSAQAGVLNVSLPTKEQSFSITVADTYPAVAPSMTLVGADKRNFLSGQVQILTGASLANCATFSRLALTESSLLPPLPLAANFPITCTSAGTQTENFMLSAGDGTKSLSLWALDSAGGISLAASSLNVTLDQTPPAVSLSNLNAEIKGGSVQSVVYTSSDATAGLNQIKLDYAADGVTFSEIADLTSSASPFAWTVPVVDQAAAKLRLRVSDLAGNATTALSNAFKIDSTVPAVAITSPAENTRLQSAVTLAGTCENGSSVSVAGTGVSAAQVVACTAGAFSVAVTFTSGDGTKSVTASQTDPAGNIGSAARNFIRDSTPPALAIIGPAANTAAKNGVYLTGSCEHSSTYATQNTLTFGGTGLASPSSTTCLADGSFASSVLFAGGDGAKALSITQTDQAGNITTVSRSFVKDANAVSLAISNPANNSSVQAGFSITGTCDSSGGASNVVIAQNAGTVLTGSPVNVNCVSGIFSQSVTVTSSDGAISVRVSQTDASSTLTNLDLNLTKDTVAPTPSIASPAVNTPAKNTVSLSGACENGLTINFAGTGIAATESLSCTDGTSGITCAPANAALCTYTKVVGLSAVDGTKNISVSQTDLAGNVGTVNRDFIRDNVGPVLTLTSHTNNQTVAATMTLVGTCETGGSTVAITSTALASAATATCSAGSFNSGALSLTGSDGVYVFTVQQSDLAGNVGALNFNLTLDATPPVLSNIVPSNGTRFKSAVIITGTCESGRSVTATGPEISGTLSDLCMASAFSITATLMGADGAKNITLSESDAVGNTSTYALTVIKDNVAPVLTQTTVTLNPHHTNSDTITFGGACEAGVDVIISGSESATRSCTAGTWSFSTSKTADGTYTYSFSQADQAGNVSLPLSWQWTRDTINPTPLVWSTPTGGQSYQSQTVVTGTCEAGTAIRFGGAGISGEFTQACTATFSQTIFFSAGDGAKSITISQTDLAGNSSSITRLFNVDNVAPSIAQTLRAYPYYTNTSSAGFAGTCETGLTVTAKRSGTTEGTTSCVGGVWSYTTQTQSGQATYDYTFEQTDPAGNVASAIARWIRDTVNPMIAITSGASQITASNSVTIAGNCESGLPSAIAVSGSATGSVTCAGGSWSYTVPTQNTDATRTYTFTLQDQAGNSSQVSATWQRIATLPNLTITTANPVINGLDSASISGTCEIGLNIEIRLNSVLENTISCPSGIYSYATSVQTTDALRSYELKQTNALPVSTTATINWYRDTTAPVFTATAFNLNNNASATPKARVDVALTAVDNLTKITHLCLKTGDLAQPLNTDNCWVAVDSAAIGLTPSLNLNVTSYGYNLPITPASYNVYAWVKDQANNISTLTNSAAGTLNRDLESITLTNPVPPTVSYVLVGSTDFPASPPSSSDLTVGAGASVFLKWKISDDQVLPSNPISVLYTTDDVTWISMATNLINGANGACEVNHASTPADNDATGCYRITTSPASGYLKFRVVVKDSESLETGASTLALNVSSTIKFLAGNTDPGLNLSAKGASFFYRRMSSDLVAPDSQTLVVTRDGVVYFKDASRGILKVDPSDGVARVFLPLTGTTIGNNVNVSSATARYINKITLDQNQPKQRLWIFDYNVIRRVDLSTNVITTVIGGGTDNADTVVNPLNARIDPYNSDPEWWDGWASFFAAPSGDFYFKAGNDGYIGGNTRPNQNLNRIRYFEASTGQIKSWRVGNITSARDIANSDYNACEVRPITFSFNPVTSAIVDRVGILRTHPTFSGCSTFGDGSRFFALDSSGNSDSANHPLSPRLGITHWWNERLRLMTGLDGKIYGFDKFDSFNGIWRYEGSPSFGWTRLVGGGTSTFLPGSCPDETDALSCRTRIGDVFVTENGTVYFLDDGRIRTITAANKIVTLMGQAQVSGFGSAATNVRLGSQINTFRLRNDGGLVFGIMALQQLFEVDPASTLYHIAGNGLTGGLTDNVDAKTTALNIEWPNGNGDHFALDPATGDIYHHAGTWNMRKLTRSSSAIGAVGMWSSFMGGGSNHWANPAADGSSSIRWDGDCSFGVDTLVFNMLSCWFGPRTFAIGGGKILTHASTLSRRISPVQDSPQNNMMKLYDLSTKVQTHLLGKNGFNTSTNNAYDGMSPVGTSLNSMDFWSADWARLNHPVHISGDRWLFSSAIVGGHQNRIYEAQPGGNLILFATLGANHRGFTYRLNGSAEYIYYCSASTNRLVRRHIQTNTEVALSWPVTQMQCFGTAMFYRSSTQSIVFSYKLNNLMGFAEYFDPM